ncbi:MAG: DUF3147 family protein [Candidatus Sulfotelmatobacter sp.]
MKVKIDATGLRQSQWYEYVVRFAFGGTITALTGLIAKRFGPEIGGLFLAFPVILPATATLIEKHEMQKKERAGEQGIVRGRIAAGVDAAGASMGAVGLAVFALIVWQRLPRSSVGIVLSEATIAWLVTSVSIWLMRELLCRRLAQKLRASTSARASGHGRRGSINRRIDE